MKWSIKPIESERTEWKGNYSFLLQPPRFLFKTVSDFQQICAAPSKNTSNTKATTSHLKKNVSDSTKTVRILKNCFSSSNQKIELENDASNFWQIYRLQILEYIQAATSNYGGGFSGDPPRVEKPSSRQTRFSRQSYVFDHCWNCAAAVSAQQKLFWIFQKPIDFRKLWIPHSIG